MMEMTKTSNADRWIEKRERRKQKKAEENNDCNKRCRYINYEK